MNCREAEVEVEHHASETGLSLYTGTGGGYSVLCAVEREQA